MCEFTSEKVQVISFKTGVVQNFRGQAEHIGANPKLPAFDFVGTLPKKAVLSTVQAARPAVRCRPRQQPGPVQTRAVLVVPID